MRRAIYEDDVIKLLDRGWKLGVYPVASNIHALPSAQPEPSQVARDIATIIENEQDMRVILQNERKKGKWVHGKLIYSDISIATCTTCGKRVPVGNFCMDCGSYNGEKERRTDEND